MAESRPRVWVSQPLFDDIVARLEEHFDVLQVPVVSEHGAGQIAAALREVDGALTAMDADELARIDRALEAMDDGEYGVCVVCGKDIPFERLKVEPMTQHCIVDKAKLEQQARA